MFIISLNRSYSKNIIVVIFATNYVSLDTSLHLNQPQKTSFDLTKPHFITLEIIFSHLTLPYHNIHQSASLNVMRIQLTSLDQNWYQLIPINFRWPQIIISTSILYPHKSQLTAFDLIYLILPLSDSIDLIIVNWLQLTSPITVSHFRWLPVISFQCALTLRVSLEVSGDILGTWIRSVIRVLYLGGRGGRLEWDTGVASLWLSYL